MAVPKKKVSKRVRNQRRSHHAIKTPNMVSCGNCSELILPHQVCRHCGHFKGSEVIQVKAV